MEACRSLLISAAWDFHVEIMGKTTAILELSGIHRWDTEKTTPRFFAVDSDGLCLQSVFLSTENFGNWNWKIIFPIDMTALGMVWDTLW